jgi:hypothetical protein
MAVKERATRAGDFARAARAHPYVQRIVEDAELRQNLLAALGSARAAYGRMNNGKSPTTALFEDKKLQREIRETASALRDATVALREPPRRRHRLRSTILLLGVGAVLALVFSESLRSKVLDMLFGAEEEFDYSSTTAPATPAPNPVGAT